MSDIELDWKTCSGLRAVCIIFKRDDGSRSHRNGYVEVPEGHPLFGVEYNQVCLAIPRGHMDQQTLGKKSAISVLCSSVGAIAGESVRRSPDIAFDVHGGLTFSGSGTKKYPVESTGWWFGFDCNHCDDGLIEPSRYDEFRKSNPVRSLEYVKQECESFAQQISNLFK